MRECYVRRKRERNNDGRMIIFPLLLSARSMLNLHILLNAVADENKVGNFSNSYYILNCANFFFLTQEY